MAGTGILTFEGCSPTEPCFQWSSWVWCSGQLFKQHSPAFLHGRCSSTAGRESPSETIPWTRQLGGRGVRPDKKQAFPWNISNLRQMYSWFGWSNMAGSLLFLNLPFIWWQYSPVAAIWLELYWGLVMSNSSRGSKASSTYGFNAIFQDLLQTKLFQWIIVFVTGLRPQCGTQGCLHATTVEVSSFITLW